jgi:hypothetical protein
MMMRGTSLSFRAPARFLFFDIDQQLRFIHRICTVGLAYPAEETANRSVEKQENLPVLFVDGRFGLIE